MARHSSVSYATPHTHNDVLPQITTRDLRKHLLEQHDRTNAYRVNGFDALEQLHYDAHHGSAPRFFELPMNAPVRF